jgi:hypothetical protein
MLAAASSSAKSGQSAAMCPSRACVSWGASSILDRKVTEVCCGACPGYPKISFRVWAHAAGFSLVVIGHAQSFIPLPTDEGAPMSIICTAGQVLDTLNVVHVMDSMADGSQMVRA